MAKKSDVWDYIIGLLLGIILVSVAIILIPILEDLEKGQYLGQTHFTGPDYIKDVVAYKEGSEGIFIYFVLADKNGYEIAEEGNLSLFIEETSHKFDLGTLRLDDVNNVLFKGTLEVKLNSFRRSKVGIGSLSSERLIASIGRITYDEFYVKPSEQIGKVRIEFTTSTGKILRGETGIIFT